MPTAEEVANQATYRRFHDAANTRDLDLIAKVIDEVVAQDARISTPMLDDAPATEALRQVWATLFRAFPDLVVTNEELIAHDDKVVARNVVTGTNDGEYMGHAPTGKVVTYDEIFIFRCVDGRIAEIRGVVDVLSQMRQLGFVAA